MFMIIWDDWGMARRYRPVERDQAFLLPPDMRDWLADGHLAWFVIDAVAVLDISRFSVRARPGRSWAGRAAYDPAMLLALLVYGYATGVRSSRRIERACGEDVAFRVICAQDVPDHATLARFRRRHFADPAAMSDLFAQVLAVAARAGLGRLGLIAVDGTKIAAAASKDANRGEAKLRDLAAQILAEAEAVDAAEDELFGDARGDELPAELADPRTRGERIAAALAELEAERTAAQDSKDAKAAQYLQATAGGPKARKPPAGAAVETARRAVERARAAQQAKIEDWQARNTASLAATGRPLRGSPPAGPDRYVRVRQAQARLDKAQARAADAERAAADQAAAHTGPVRNITDPGSRLMPVRGGGFIQGYNAQAVCSADGLCLASMVTQDTTDYASFEPMMRGAQAAAGLLRAHARGPLHRLRAKIGIMLADAGYCSAANLTIAGPDRLIATGKGRDLEQAAREGGQARPARDSPLAAMATRLATPQGIACYRRRGPLAEGPFGNIKHNHGFRRFSMQGLSRAQGEWAFQNTVINLLKIHATGWVPAQA
jgi:transposase